MTRDHYQTIAIVLWAGVVALAAVLAARKGRNAFWAVVAAVFFGIFALLAIAIMPAGRDGRTDLAPPEHRGIRGKMRQHRELRAEAARRRVRPD